LGQYQPAANTVQMAMQALPEGEWGTVVNKYAEIYPRIEQYTNQLKALEEARDTTPDDPALRFLLGYHFGYLGYPKQAVTELDKGLALEPKDVGAQKLRAIFAAQAGLPARPAAPPPPVPQPPTPDSEQPAPPNPAAPPARPVPPNAAPNLSGVPA
jgi:tetratricopeptide (TPR) repeat protein